MPIAEPDRTKGSIPKGLDGCKGAYRGYGEGERRLIEVNKRKRDKGGRTALCVSVSHACRCDVKGGNRECREWLLRRRDGGWTWTMSMALLDMLVGHDLSVLRIALLCDLGRKRK
jgi:hypothetical protein